MASRAPSTTHDPRFTASGNGGRSIVRDAAGLGPPLQLSHALLPPPGGAVLGSRTSESQSHALGARLFLAISEITTSERQLHLQTACPEIQSLHLLLSCPLHNHRPCGCATLGHGRFGTCRHRFQQPFSSRATRLYSPSSSSSAYMGENDASDGDGIRFRSAKGA